MRAAEKFPQRPALSAQGKTLIYGELRELACRIAATIQAHTEFSATPLTAVFAYRTPAAFAGALGALLAGNGYVPLNRTFPLQRTQAMLERSECRSLVVDLEIAAAVASDPPRTSNAVANCDSRPARQGRCRRFASTVALALFCWVPGTPSG
jgi:non-ribosomal peptide synthetase component F